MGSMSLKSRLLRLSLNSSSELGLCRLQPSAAVFLRAGLPFLAATAIARHSVVTHDWADAEVTFELDFSPIGCHAPF